MFSANHTQKTTLWTKRIGQTIFEAHIQDLLERGHRYMPAMPFDNFSDGTLNNLSLKIGALNFHFTYVNKYNKIVS